jgi:23S rRNA pseudouridine1911/1915/1917 synthase
MARRFSGATPRNRARSDELRVVYEDDTMLVLNKRARVLSVPLERRRAAVSVYDQIETYFRSHGKRLPFIVHRIDRDTSGLVVFAKSAWAQQRLKEQFRRREPERVYWAVVYGHPKPSTGIWRDLLVWDRVALVQKEAREGDRRAIEAICHYRVVETFRAASLVEVRLRTGRRNQIRIQAELHGHTLVGERRYSPESEPRRAIPFERQALHAYKLALQHPVDARRLEFEAPLPPDLLNLLKRLRRQR